MFGKITIIYLVALFSLVPVRVQQIVRANDLNHLITKILHRERKENPFLLPIGIKSLNTIREKTLDSTISNVIYQSDTIWYMTSWTFMGVGREEIFNSEYLFESGFHFKNYALDAYTDCFKHDGRHTSDERMIRSWDKEWIEKVKSHPVNDGREIVAAMIIREKKEGIGITVKVSRIIIFSY